MDKTTTSSPEYSKMHMRKLFILSIAMVGTMTTWFSMTAVLPEVTERWLLSAVGESLITITVQAGFVVGALFSAFLNIPDRIQPSVLFFWSASLAGLSTLLIVLVANSFTMVLVLRFVTGVTLSGVYGPGLKLMSTWFRLRRGMALGFVVGALTLGSATPHLFSVFWLGTWEVVLIIAGLTSIVSGLLVIAFVSNGPYSLPVSTFDVRAIPRVVRYKPVRLANYGYFGHIWELYAMWSWFGVFLTYSLRSSGMNDPALSSILTFVVIASGFFGAWFGGILADKFGRERLTLWSLGISGFISLTIGFCYGGSPWIIVTLGIVWGTSIIADSAQFSALIIEHADERYVGSALTFQLAVGFAITIIAILTVPFIEAMIGWRYAFLILVPGPIIGFVSMIRLTRLKKMQGREKVMSA